jgi:hypothetical protein
LVKAIPKRNTYASKEMGVALDYSGESGEEMKPD